MASGRDEHQDLNAFEAALAALAPRSERLNRERLMFLAGQASLPAARGGRRWAWPAAFGAMTAVAAGLLLAVVIRAPQAGPAGVAPLAAASAPEADVAAVGGERPKVPPSPDQAPRPRPLLGGPGSWVALCLAPWEKRSAASRRPAESYLQLRDQVLSQGLDAWPQPPGAAVADGAAAPEDAAAPPAAPRSQRELFDELIQKPAAPRAEHPRNSTLSTLDFGARS